MSSSSDPDSPQSRAESRAEIARRVESSRKDVEAICHKIIWAINEGNFNPNDGVWPEITTSDFKAAAAFAGFPRFCTLPELLKAYWKHKREHPCYAISLKEDDILTKVDEQKGFARAHVNILSDGIPCGQIRQSVAQLDFRNCNGKWLCHQYQCMPGMEPGPASRNSSNAKVTRAGSLHAC